MMMTGATDEPVRESVVHHSINGSFSIRRGDWKLILCRDSGGWSNPRPRKGNAKLPPGVQLYDMRADVAETANVEKQNPEVVRELTELLQSYVDRGRSTPGPAQTNNGDVKIKR